MGPGLFRPGAQTLHFRLVDRGTGRVAGLELPARRSGAYYQALVLVMAGPGETCSRPSTPGGVELEAPVTVEG